MGPGFLDQCPDLLGIVFQQLAEPGVVVLHPGPVAEAFKGLEGFPVVVVRQVVSLVILVQLLGAAARTVVQLYLAVPFRLFTNGYLNAALPDLSPSDRFEHWTDHGIPAR